MNRRTVVLAVVAGVATVAITASITGGQSSSLPLPHPVAATAAGTKATSPGSGKKASTTTTSAPTGIQGGVTTTTLAQLTTCAVSVSNPSPTQGNTDETVTVTAVPEAYVSVVANYPHRPIKHTGPIGASGTTSFPISISHSPVGTTVTITGSASLEGNKVTCSAASFTPVA